MCFLYYLLLCSANLASINFFSERGGLSRGCSVFNTLASHLFDSILNGKVGGCLPLAVYSAKSSHQLAAGFLCL